MTKPRSMARHVVAVLKARYPRALTQGEVRLETGDRTHVGRTLYDCASRGEIERLPTRPFTFRAQSKLSPIDYHPCVVCGVSVPSAVSTCGAEECLGALYGRRYSRPGGRLHLRALALAAFFVCASVGGATASEDPKFPMIEPECMPSSEMKTKLRERGFTLRAAGLSRAPVSWWADDSGQWFMVGRVLDTSCVMDSGFVWRAS